MGVVGALERGAVHHVVDRFYELVLEGDHERYRFHHRTGLEGEDRAVERLAVGAVVEQLDVGYSLDFARGHLHEHGGAPFGIGLFADFLELILKHFLKIDVDGSMDVVSPSGRGGHPVGYSAGHGHALGEARLAVEKRVERHFQAGISVDLARLLVLVDTAYAAVGHFAVWVDADVAVLTVKGIASAASVEILEIGESLYALEVLECLVAGQTEGAVAPLGLLLEFLLEFRVP